MTYTASTLQAFLAERTPFGDLPPAVLEQVAERLQPLRYRMGQTIALREKMPDSLILLYQGQARLLGYEPATQMPIALQLLEPGEIIGLAGLIRGVPCETAIASTESVGFSLSTQDFFKLLRDYPEWSSYLQSRPYLIEIFEILARQEALEALGAAQLKTIALKADRHARIYSIEPRQSVTSELNGDCLWFLSSGSLGDLPSGSCINVEAERAPLRVTGNRPARLLGLRESDLVVEDEPSPAEPAPPEDITAPLDTSFTPVPYAPDPVIDLDASPRAEPAREQRRGRYPFVRGGSSLEVGLACFQMLCQYFQIPFRREVLRRVLADQLQRNGSLSLYFCGAVAELLGINAQLMDVPARAMTRLQTPALVMWQDSLAILYEISDRACVIAVPEIGILRRKPADFLETWGNRGQVLLLQPTKETPQERFGLSWFWPSIWRYRIVLLEVFIASFFVQLFGLANPLIVQIIIDQVIVKNTPDLLQSLGLFLIVVAFLEALLSTLRTYLFVDTTNRIDLGLGSEIIDHLVRLPLRYFERRPVGEVASRVNELENIRSFLTGTALTVVLDSIFSVVYIVVMVIYSWKLTLVALAAIPAFILLTLLLSPTIRSQIRAKAERNAETQAYLVEVTSGIQTVKAQNIELRSRWQWQERYARYVSAGFKTVITSTFAQSANNFFNKFSGLVVLWAGAFLVLEGKLSLGELIAFRIIAGYVTSPLLRLAQLWQNFQEVGLSLERLSDIVDTPQEAEADRNNIPLPAISGAIKYENVTFRFKANTAPQLVNVNLEIQPGQFVGIVGQSGAGKSTLVKLLARLYNLETGRIFIDGYDIAKVELYSLRRQIGVVPQDTLLFDGTVQDNIAINNPDASTDEIIEAAQIAAAHDFIMGLPNGYNTRVGERGAGLSGGQRQRIAIARTILQSPEMVVLDEATSALDYTTERQLCSNLAEAFAERTVLFVTHRLATIKNADIIVMMDKGAVVEVGSHDDLMGLRGRYYSLYQQQEAAR
ncbi:peptidase domain-containing ABC transporter [Oscillatoria sp. FACHB-1406]|uniref:peptidase domain-containing ABC transporter n=1 Tax=Oscillatoria sp. FACHB-1406 TaxID=2692846 RepID=UPI001681D6E0|nr:peptidase domain-containing ABC transporter [Oscillatoria sp. FACHB-1406]MBD2577881.1 peptidase domain-containing ABC transporter [Oscillatoria sp. FACHB-1406]